MDLNQWIAGEQNPILVEDSSDDVGDPNGIELCYGHSGDVSVESNASIFGFAAATDGHSHLESNIVNSIPA